MHAQPVITLPVHYSTSTTCMWLRYGPVVT